MTERRTIGQILTSLGRITEDDVQTALAYQRDKGGYFGEALTACGLITQEELDWGIASQFDLPYVFPDADSVDLAAASLVSADWALSNLMLPILQTHGSLKVVTDSPLKTEAVEELAAMTGLEVDLSLASPMAIRDLVRKVYARATSGEVERGPAIALSEALDIILLVESARFGVSARGARAWAWWDQQGEMQRRPLTADWRSAMDVLLVPGPPALPAGTQRTTWMAEFHRAGADVPVEVEYLEDESGREYLFRVTSSTPTLEQRFPPPGDGVLSEVRLLARSGSARFVVITNPAELGHEILPHLPSLLLDPSWRSVYINGNEGDAANEAFSVRMPADPATWSAELDALRAFHFDVVTVDLSGGDNAWAESALDVASVAFLAWGEADERRVAYDAGIRWILRIERDPEGLLQWSLDPLNA
jgi:hypothetical protein